MRVRWQTDDTTPRALTKRTRQRPFSSKSSAVSVFVRVPSSNVTPEAKISRTSESPGGNAPSESDTSTSCEPSG